MNRGDAEAADRNKFEARCRSGAYHPVSVVNDSMCSLYHTELGGKMQSGCSVACGMSDSSCFTNGRVTRKTYEHSLKVGAEDCMVQSCETEPVQRVHRCALIDQLSHLHTSCWYGEERATCLIIHGSCRIVTEAAPISNCLYEQTREYAVVRFLDVCLLQTATKTFLRGALQALVRRGPDSVTGKQRWAR